MTKFGYARVSTISQDLEVQLNRLKEEGCEKIYSEKFTGTKKDRPEFLKLLEELKEGDTMVVTKLDRFARSTVDAVQTVRTLFDKGVRVHILNMGIIAGLIRPSNGQVMVEGKPLSEYEEKSWFNQLSYISQNPYLFSGTIAENIAIEGGRSFTQEELDRAIERAGLSGMIRNLKDGANTLIGEGGRGLSGGEKQRVALARAFLKEPSIILFDEPTNGLDLETERLLQWSIQKLSKQATIITVAHRLYTIKDADQILFMKEGQLKAVGSHDDLYDRIAEYREMVTVQRGESAS